MGLHATREDEVDRLLRGGVFVDLYRVVQQGVRVSQESYSIKKLEPLYGLTREVALRDAGSSIVNFELWLDGGRANQPLLDLIEAYNRDDCVSNLRAAGLAGGAARGRGRRRHRCAPPGARRRRPQRRTCPRSRPRSRPWSTRLTSDLPPTDERTPEQQATWLLAQLLDWHRREDKATWWQLLRVPGDDRRGAAR